ncbi:sensor histidine kinase [Corynebacterium spheniscorum]|uniref:Oxygen sensor histidine kinase NreB n=1 Tax=Corynebacterium spheniscorum TaxID=185761 RepID=A0A1I2ULN5_9CORY|nr:histidine kinase [Corynebacterium spheniscorum]KAA8720203.1 sensor histidine kinase [Corynebacterium spheniscorum]SFG78064.1 Signal transduction histidine kinase [Corynebacterium spheniscorum]
MRTLSQPRTRPHMDHLLLAMRVAVHVLFALLLGLALIRLALNPTPLSHWIWPLAVLFAAIYLLGTVLERRAAARGDSLPPIAIHLWILIISALWVALVMLSPAFLWLLFPLVFIIASCWPYRLSLPWILLLLLAATLLPTSQPRTSAAILGPTVGVLVAVGMQYAYRVLVSEARYYAQVAENLHATRKELATSEREAGRLAERERLAREIHDTLTQGFSSIVLLSRASQHASEQGNTALLQEQLHAIENVASDNLNEARRVVDRLGTLPARRRLPEELHALAQSTSAQQALLGQPLSITVHLAGDSERLLPPEVIEELLRIAQQGLGNIVQHAQATEAVISLGIWDESLTLDIFDNGRGVDAARSEGNTAGGGFGSTSIRQRVTRLGGDVRLEDATDTFGQGTILTVSIPLAVRQGS